MIILGIDPGIATTGYGIISYSKNKKRSNELSEKNNFPFSCLAYGMIKTSPGLSSAERLKILYNELNKLIKKYRPEVMAVETIYFFKNLKTAMPVSQAKGVILLSAAKKKIPVYEITPLQAKMAITGYGRAEKEQVQQIIKVLLNLEKVPRPDDIADALAVSICCAGTIKIKEQ